MAIINGGILIYGCWQSYKQKQWIWFGFFGLSIVLVAFAWFFVTATLTLGQAFQSLQI